MEGKTVTDTDEKNEKQRSYNLLNWLPTTKKEVELRGWDRLDVIIFGGDAYVDHPAFGAAVIGRLLEHLGLQVAIVPQPDWRGDHRDFTKLGEPRMFFAIAPGAMDSMVNHYTANRRLRSNDAYSPDNKAGLRPNYPSIVYAKILKELYPHVPVVLGGIEASMRRLAHYDYWIDHLRPGILDSSPADLLIYGMGEKPVTELVRLLKKGVPFNKIKNIPQTAYIMNQEYLAMKAVQASRHIMLHSYEDCKKDRRRQAENFHTIEIESNSCDPHTLLQFTGKRLIVVNPPYPPVSQEELDAWYALPYTRLPHPKYEGKKISAYTMIRHSVTTHRGCFGGCSFCTISAHQGKTVVSRSALSVMREVMQITKMPDFVGNISDLGGPTANMYKMGGIDKELCRQCYKPSCIYPKRCANLCTDHSPLLALYREAAAYPGVKNVFIGSGIRYDLLMPHEEKELTPALKVIDRHAREYIEEVILHHVSGRLKVAPEHTENNILKLMRKPAFDVFIKFHSLFNEIIKEHHLKEQLVPYFISAHPGCTLNDMIELATKINVLNYHLQQVQEFTPTPMTLATEMYYTGFIPSGKLEKVHTVTNQDERKKQHDTFFMYNIEKRNETIDFLKKLGRNDLLAKFKKR